jgi:hypothetical protein
MESDFDSVDQALTILECAEVVQEFDDSVWLKVDRADWEAFNNAFNGEAHK